jgi:hypothetical protein
MGITNYFVVINGDEMRIGFIAAMTEMKKNMLTYGWDAIGICCSRNESENLGLNFRVEM